LDGGWWGIAKDVGVGVITFVAGATLKGLYDSRKRIQFASSGWTFQFQHYGSEMSISYKTDPPAKWNLESKLTAAYSFTMRIFNERPEATGLHKFSVQFTRQLPAKRLTLLQDDAPSHGRGSIVAGRVSH
jgi:hypothetical protein